MISFQCKKVYFIWRTCWRWSISWWWRASVSCTPCTGWRRSWVSSIINMMTVDSNNDPQASSARCLRCPPRWSCWPAPWPRRAPAALRTTAATTRSPFARCHCWRRWDCNHHYIDKQTMFDNDAIGTHVWKTLTDGPSGSVTTKILNWKPYISKDLFRQASSILNFKASSLLSNIVKHRLHVCH